MNTLPVPFIERIKQQLPGEAELFLAALQTPPPVSIRLNPGKLQSVSALFAPEQSAGEVEWCSEGHYLCERPVFTLDPGFHGGAYYVQEASSMFLQHVFRQIRPAGPLKVLDLCAAPGGKSTLIAAELSADSLLVSNEVIRNRAAVLKENVLKWGQDNIVVTNNAPEDFRPLSSLFDIILVDAPCSGEGMFRKDEEAVREWNENNLRLCSQRQQSILSDIWGSLKPGGFLIYSTCTYNRQENEAILEWVSKTFPARGIDIVHPFPAVTPGDSTLPCYRFYPHKLRGEGFFIGVMQKTDGAIPLPSRHKNQPAGRLPRLLPELREYIRQPERYDPYEKEGIWGILPLGMSAFIRTLEKQLHVLYKGCEIAEAVNRKIKLSPSLALWQGLQRENCRQLELERPEALKFLKKEEFSAPPLSGDWLWVTYRNIGLGWCKNLGSRLNNYYPKAWRIRMNI